VLQRAARIWEARPTAWMHLDTTHSADSPAGPSAGSRAAEARRHATPAGQEGEATRGAVAATGQEEERRHATPAGQEGEATRGAVAATGQEEENRTPCWYMWGTEEEAEEDGGAVAAGDDSVRPWATSEVPRIWQDALERAQVQEDETSEGLETGQQSPGHPAPLAAQPREEHLLGRDSPSAPGVPSAIPAGAAAGDDPVAEASWWPVNVPWTEVAWRVELWIQPLPRYRDGWPRPHCGPWVLYSVLWTDTWAQIPWAIQAKETGGLYHRLLICAEQYEWDETGRRWLPLDQV
jgi:hypothetical protein